MIRAFSLAAAIFAATLLTFGPAQADDKMKPFVLASNSAGDVAAKVAEVSGKLAGGGFEVVATHSPYPAATIIIVTNDALKSAAAQSDFGGYGVAQRVSVTKAGGNVQVAFTNPNYMAAAYRMKADLSAIRKQLAAALGEMQEYGPPEGLDDDDLRDYHYMFGMPYFDEPHELNKAASHKAMVDMVEKGLAAGTSGVTKVFRIDIPGKEETVFGVAMDGSKGDGNMQDDVYIMEQIDFKELKSSAHLPFEILVSGDTAYALSAKFRIAINFPDLSMMGSNSFMSIMESPATIQKALTLASGGKPESSN